MGVGSSGCCRGTCARPSTISRCRPGSASAPFSAPICPASRADGQRIGALFCAHLPERLGWLEEALAASVDLEFLSPDFAKWLPAVGIDAPGHAMLGPSWIQPLSVVAQLGAALAPATP